MYCQILFDRVTGCLDRQIKLIIESELLLVVGGLNKPTILNSTSDDDNQIAILWLFAPPSTSCEQESSIFLNFFDENSTVN